MTEEEKGLKELVSDLTEEIKEVKRKEKPFRLPFKARLGRAKAKKGFISVCYIGPNLNVEFTKARVEDNTVNVKGTYYEMTPDDIMSYKGKPIVIVSSWNERPYSPRADFQQAIDNKSLTTGQRYIINKLESDAIKPKKPLAGL